MWKTISEKYKIVDKIKKKEYNINVGRNYISFILKYKLEQNLKM